jgi:hypothetical protein
MALDEFDRLLSAYQGLPDVLKTETSTIRTTPYMPVNPDTGERLGTTTWTVQTLRVKDDKGRSGDMVFVEYARADDHRRVVLPPQVTMAIARQRARLTEKSMSKAGKERFERNGNPFQKHKKA